MKLSKKATEPMPQWMSDMLGASNVTSLPNGVNNKLPLSVVKPKLDYNYTAPSSEDISQFAANSWPIEEEKQMRFEELKNQQELEKSINDQEKIEQNKRKYILMQWHPSTQDPEGTIKIKDTRVIDELTGEKLKPNRRMDSTAGKSTIKHIIEGSIKRGIDPYIPLAIGMQETNFKYMGNPLQFNFPGHKLKDEDWLKLDNPEHKMLLDETLDFLKEKIKYAKDLGYKTDEKIIQAWNGYGKPDPNIFGNYLYGQKLSEMKPMSENPIYGRKIVNLRDSVIKKNPEIVKMVNEAMKNKKTFMEFKEYIKEKNKGAK